ncbi:beta-lactamase domain-containing protein [Candidatus Magnetoovum chiemensis]|nr:beta-lactamase domain-containing protein [Candidatus Magnetoovum chiemensis]
MDKIKRFANMLRSKGVVSKLKEAESDINKYLKPCFKDNSSGDTALILRRWNSYTPALKTTDENSLGGGYFISWHGKGIVIDPGFDFIRNFHNAGFSIGCIHAIIMTHSHLDHISDFEPLLTLLYEYNDQRKRDEKAGKKNEHIEPKYIHIYASLGTLKKCAGWLDFTHLSRKNETMISRIYPLDPFSHKNAFNIPDTDIFIKPTYAKHNEIIASGYSIGLLVDLYGKNSNKEITIGLTSDTAWTKEVEEQFNDCDILIMHIGTVTEKELITYEPYSKHLGAVGCLKFLTNDKSKCKLYLFSEFGEEFRESRREIISTIKGASATPDKCIVADVGTRIKLPEGSLMCEYTNCNEEAMNRDFYEYYGVVKHYCKEHIPYKSKWTVFE